MSLAYLRLKAKLNKQYGEANEKANELNILPPPSPYKTSVEEESDSINQNIKAFDKLKTFM